MKFDAEHDRPLSISDAIDYVQNDISSQQYEIANISPDENRAIDRLEGELTSRLGDEIALVAYARKH